MANRSGGTRKSAKTAKTSLSARAVPPLDGPNRRSMATRSGEARNAAGPSTSSSGNVMSIADNLMTTQSMGARSDGARNSARIAKNTDKATRSTPLGLARRSFSDSSRKRKAVGDNMESASKRGRMVEASQAEDNNDGDYEEDEEEESVKKKGDVLGRLLSPLLQHMNQFMQKHSLLQDVSWLDRFQERKKNLERQQGTILKQIQLLNLQDLIRPFGRPQDAQPDHPAVSNISKALVEDLERLERLQEKCIAACKRIPPSQYCRAPIWQQCQDIPGLTIRSGRYLDLSSPSYPIGLEQLHSCFRLFTAFMLHPHNPNSD